MKTLLNKKRIWMALAAVFFSATVIVSCYSLRKPTSQTAYVDIGLVYAEFGLKKELEAKYTNVQSARKRIIDSLNLELTILSNRLSQNLRPGIKDSLEQQFSVKRQEFMYRKQAFDADNDAVTEQYTEQIWKQLNQYVTDYGKANGYDYIFGGDGSGSLMYAREGLNITDKVKIYVNQSYKGGK